MISRRIHLFTCSTCKMCSSLEMNKRGNQCALGAWDKSFISSYYPRQLLWGVRWQCGLKEVPVLFKRNGILWMIEGHGRSIKFDLHKQSLICFPKSVPDYMQSCLEVPQWEEAGFPSGHECWCVWFCCFSVQWKERFNPVTIELNKMVLCLPVPTKVENEV